jgi:hypothetical protein
LFDLWCLIGSINLTLAQLESAAQYRTASGSDRMLESTNLDPNALKQSEQFPLEC